MKEKNNATGRFYFKQTNNGNLLGEFSNTHNTTILIEGANRVEGICSVAFVGKYETVWLDPVETIEQLTLTISYRENTNCLIYSLFWRDKENKLYFYGEGFVVDSILIGDYNNFGHPEFQTKQNQ